MFEIIMKPKRYDPIIYNNNGPGWSWDSNAIKEASEGDYVKFEEYDNLRKLLAAAEPHMRHSLNCLARSGNFRCGCGMQAWEDVRKIIFTEPLPTKNLLGR